MASSRLRRMITAWGSALAVLMGLITLPAAASAAPVRPGQCPEVEAISVRGSTERQGGGSIAGPVAERVRTDSARTVRVHDLVYPASLSGYSRSVATGVRALEARLRETSAQCASTRFVLVGFSQGANVIGNALESRTLPAGDRVAAVVFFGDPTFRASEPYNVGSFSRLRNGSFPRSAGALSMYADTLRSYCNGDDNFCQRGARGTGHYRYAIDRDDSVAFIRGRIGG